METDRWIQSIAAGMNAREIRAILRGEPPTHQPNPRKIAHTLNFLLHFRPRSWPQAATRFTHTFRLGFFAVFFLLIEIVTGLILMLYYVPTPQGAYPSILRINAQIFFGELIRDIHRLGGEAMVACVVLHLLRIYLTDSYKKERCFTWFSGVGLLIITLGLAFSGYLLPWDQVAYWAITIGTSMAETVPFFGRQLNLLLRGGADIGADGLLRFYLMHVGILPFTGICLLAVHYYRVSRRHGLSLPAGLDSSSISETQRKKIMKPVPFIPDMLTQEIFLASISLLILIAIAGFFYDAPLESHADPGQTPLDIQAPWFFLWIQGLLKLGDKQIMGVLIPLAGLLGLLCVPLVDRTPRRTLFHRPIALLIAMTSVMALLLLGFTGTHHYGIDQPPAMRIIQNLAPEEGNGPIHKVPYDQLAVGMYSKSTDVEMMPAKLSEVFKDFRERVIKLVELGEMPHAESILIVEDWQVDLRRVTLRIVWTEAKTGQRNSQERVVHLHRNRGENTQK
jgi:quinol-cytochrome oxidoreductase complex cytochrome b subunit